MANHSPRTLSQVEKAFPCPLEKEATLGPGEIRLDNNQILLTTVSSLYHNGPLPRAERRDYSVSRATPDLTPVAIPGSFCISHREAGHLQGGKGSNGPGSREKPCAGRQCYIAFGVCLYYIILYFFALEFRNV